MTRPSTDWKEIVREGEDAHLQRLAEELRELQRRQPKSGRVGRALHVKGHLGVEASLEVRADLPEHARQGLFAAPKKYSAYVRFSNGAPRHQPDRAGDFRGLAIKVVGVEGKKLIPGLEDAKTQDFLFIKVQNAAFRSAEEFVATVVAGSGNPLLVLPRLGSRIGFGRAVKILASLASAFGSPFKSFAGQPMYSVLPIRVGAYAGRIALLPVGASKLRSPSNGGLAEDLKAHLRSGALEWDLAIQFFLDEQRTPIEDPSVAWKESETPYVPVARLRIAVEDIDSERSRKIDEYVDTLSFDPWHALAEHRPLGEMMRARNHAYRLSTIERGAAPEPDGTERF